MLIKVLIIIGLVVITLTGIAAVSTIFTFVQIVKEQKNIKAVERDLDLLRSEIDLRKGRSNDILGSKQSSDN